MNKNLRPRSAQRNKLHYRLHHLKKSKEQHNHLKKKKKLYKMYPKMNLTLRERLAIKILLISLEK